MKKLLCMTLAVVLSLCMLLACSAPATEESTTAAESATTEEQSASADTAAAEEAVGADDTAADAAGDEDYEKFDFTYGHISKITTDPSAVARIESIKTVVEAAGGKFIQADTDMSPEKTMNSLNQLISQGVNAVTLVPSADSLIPRVQKACEDAGVYFGFMFRDANDPEIKEALMASPYYVGNVMIYSYDAVYRATEKLADLGVTNLALFGQLKGDIDGDIRDQAVIDCAADRGITLLPEARQLTDPSEATKVVDGLISAYPEMDGILILATGPMPGITDAIITALDAHGKTGEVKVGLLDYVPGIVDMIENDQLHVAIGGEILISAQLLAAMVVNNAIGTPLSDEPYTISPMFSDSASLEDIQDYFKYVEGEIPPYTQQEVRDMLLKAYNPDVTSETLITLANDFSVEDVKQRHEGMV